MHKGTERILKERYLWEWEIDGEKSQETVDMMLLRVAKKIASAYLQVKPDYNKVNELAHKFYDVMITGKFLPSSPQLFNAMRGYGNDKKSYDLIYKQIDDMTEEDWNTINEFKNSKAAYGSCYAMGRIGDSIEEIYESLKQQAMIFKSAGGYGVSFSDLRPEGALVSTTMGESCGPIGFMDLFNINTDKIALSGKTKRGANMFSLSVSHPDIEKFITRKSEMAVNEKGELGSKYLDHVNISVEIIDEFIEALEEDKDWDLIDPHNKETVKKVKARDLWRLLTESSEKSAEPAIIMIDNINRFNPIRHIETIKSVNPCVTGDTLIPTNIGLVRADALKTGMKTWNPIKMQMDEIVLVYNNGIQDIYKVTVENGMTLKATGEHKLKVKTDDSSELIPINDIKIGQKVYMILGYNNEENVSKYDLFTGVNSATECLLKVTSIEYAGQDYVYDINVPDDYMWVTNGFVSLDCQEYQGFDNTVCNLGSVNLYAMLKESSFGEYNGVVFDYRTLEETVNAAVIYLNLSLLANEYPLEILTKKSLDYRPIGLGFMGLGSIFMRMGMEYGSEESKVFAKEFIDNFVLYTIRGSNEFYHMSGVKFKNYEHSDYAMGEFRFNNKHKEEISNMLKDGITNSRLNAIAPTGFISMFAAYLTSDASSVSGGVEPVFSLRFTRTVNPNADEEFVIEQNDIAVKDTLTAMGHDEATIKKFMDGDQKAKHIVNHPRFKTAEELTADQHLSILEIISNAIDMSASKTINLPETTTIEEISQLYVKAYKMGIKGVSIFRKGSREAVLKDKSKDKKNKLSFDLGLNITDKGKIMPKERPIVIQALKKNVHFNDDNGDKKIMNIEVGFDEKNEPFEVFIRASTTTKSYTELFNAVGRLLSLSFRTGADVETAIKQIKKVKNWRNDYSVVCQVIASTVEELVQLGKAKTKKKQQQQMDKINKSKLMTSPKGYLIDQETGDAYCPVCMAKQGEGLKFESGCINCMCGWSACA